MEKVIIIALNIEGFHYYPEAPKEVEFLSARHRHTFKVKAAFSVKESNRELEFFIMRDKLSKFFHESFGSPCEFGERSCEHICEIVLRAFSGHSLKWVEVWEEETGGARIDS